MGVHAANYAPQLVSCNPVVTYMVNNIQPDSGFDATLGSNTTLASNTGSDGSVSIIVYDNYISASYTTGTSSSTQTLNIGAYSKDNSAVSNQTFVNNVFTPPLYLTLPYAPLIGFPNPVNINFWTMNTPTVTSCSQGTTSDVTVVGSSYPSYNSTFLWVPATTTIPVFTFGVYPTNTIVSQMALPVTFPIPVLWYDAGITGGINTTGSNVNTWVNRGSGTSTYNLVTSQTCTNFTTQAPTTSVGYNNRTIIQTANSRNTMQSLSSPSLNALAISPTACTFVCVTNYTNGTYYGKEPRAYGNMLFNGTNASTWTNLVNVGATGATSILLNGQISLATSGWVIVVMVLSGSSSKYLCNSSAVSTFTQNNNISGNIQYLNLGDYYQPDTSLNQSACGVHGVQFGADNGANADAVFVLGSAMEYSYQNSIVSLSPSVTYTTSVFGNNSHHGGFHEQSNFIAYNNSSKRNRQRRFIFRKRVNIYLDASNIWDRTSVFFFKYKRRHDLLLREYRRDSKTVPVHQRCEF